MLGKNLNFNNNKYKYKDKDKDKDKNTLILEPLKCCYMRIE